MVSSDDGSTIMEEQMLSQLRGKVFSLLYISGSHFEFVNEGIGSRTYLTCTAGPDVPLNFSVPAVARDLIRCFQSCYAHVIDARGEPVWHGEIKPIPGEDLFSAEVIQLRPKP